MNDHRTNWTKSEDNSCSPDNPCILIPAFKPDRRMLDLVRELRQHKFRIIIVDDGSGDKYLPLFDEAARMDCLVLRHSINMGKGRSLKTGLNEAMNCGYADNGVITADADGQHSPADIIKIAIRMREKPGSMVLGKRNFKGKVPWRSRFGNGMTRMVFALINGERIYDTQTGLRGLPASCLELFLSLSGERYEYEMNMLLAARPNLINIEEVPIDTIYIEGNKSSHFRVLQDSIIIYRLILKYSLSSLISFIVDYFIFILMNISFPEQLMASVFTARSISSLVNFLVNRNFVFRHKGTAIYAVLGYYVLVVAIMIANYGLIKLLSGGLNLNVYLAKIIADTVLYFVSFRVQRDCIFRQRK